MNLKEQKWLVLLYVLMELGGGKQRSEVLEYIQNSGYWYKNDSNDITRETRNEKAWRNDFSFERQHLVDQGYMKAGGNGKWLITEAGSDLLKSLIKKAESLPDDEDNCFTAAFYAKLFPSNSNADFLADQILLEDLSQLNELTELQMSTMNLRPEPVGPMVEFIGSAVRRNPGVAQRALFYANHLCEIDSAHPSFLRRNRQSLYMEPHHLIPLSMTNFFKVNLDREENVFSLCSNCHNQIHYGTKEDVRELLTKLFEARKTQICAILGQEIGLDDLFKIYGVDF